MSNGEPCPDCGRVHGADAYSDRIVAMLGAIAKAAAAKTMCAIKCIDQETKESVVVLSILTGDRSIATMAVMIEEKDVRRYIPEGATDLGHTTVSEDGEVRHHSEH